MLLPLLLLSIGLAHGFIPYGNLTFQQVTDMINSTLQGPFNKYIEKDVADEMADIIRPNCTSELQKLVDLRNRVVNGEVTMPQSPVQALALLKSEVPATYDRAQRLFGNFLTKYNNLSTEAKAYYDDMEKSWSTQNLTGDMKERIATQIQVFLDQNDKFQHLSSDVKAEYHRLWPNFMSFIDSGIYRAIVNILKGANPKNIGSTVASLMALYENQQGQPKP